MAKMSGQDALKILVIAFGVLIIIAYIVPLVWVGGKFQISGLQQITASAFIWKVILGMLLLYFAVFLLGKSETIWSAKTFFMVAILSVILYIVAYTLDKAFNLGLNLPFELFAIKAQSIMPLP